MGSIWSVRVAARPAGELARVRAQQRRGDAGALHPRGGDDGQGHGERALAETGDVVYGGYSLCAFKFFHTGHFSTFSPAGQGLLGNIRQGGPSKYRVFSTIFPNSLEIRGEMRYYVNESTAMEVPMTMNKRSLRSRGAGAAAGAGLRHAADAGALHGGARGDPGADRRPGGGARRDKGRARGHAVGHRRPQGRTRRAAGAEIRPRRPKRALTVRSWSCWTSSSRCTPSSWPRRGGRWRPPPRRRRSSWPPISAT